MDALATLRDSDPWLDGIRTLGVPAAFVAQDGCSEGLIPWGAFDVLFLGGSTEFKIGEEGRAVAAEAFRRGIPVHMGRVNSLRRLKIAKEFGCRSVDGTHLAFGPSKKLPELLSWMEVINGDTCSQSSDQ